MADITRYERLATIILIAALIPGAALFAYKRMHRHPDITVQTFSMTRTESLSPPVMRTIDINLASAEELMRIRGIGPVLAKRIVEDRALRGLFRSKEDVRRVKGIGDKLYLLIRDEIAAE